MPGPAAVPERVRAAAALPVLSHRGPEFRAILAEVTQRLRGVLGTRHDVFLLGASGTGGMEAALVNVLSAGDAVLVVENGQFGERFSSIAEGLPVQLDRLQIPWGEVPDAAVIAARVKAKPYRAVVVVHNESATGVVADLAAIGAVLRDTETLLVVDSVSGVGGVEMRMDEWGVDVVVTASQKSLMCPPGLAIAAVSAKAMRVVQAAHGIPRFFFDFRRAKASLDKGETPFTPPVSLILGLREALAMIDEEGLPAVLARHARLSAALRAGFEALGFPDVSDRPAVLAHRHGRRRPRRARRVGDRPAHVCQLPHRDRGPAHQAAQPRHPHRHDGICRSGGHSRRSALPRMHAARSRPRAGERRGRAGGRRGSGAIAPVAPGGLLSSAVVCIRFRCGGRALQQRIWR